MDTRLIDINELSTRIKGTIYDLVCPRRIPFVKSAPSLRFDLEEVIRSLSHYTVREGRHA
jgi:hypothetical protein